MQPFQPKPTINRCFGESLQFNLVVPACPPQPVASPPRSPVRTELILGLTKVATDTAVVKNTQLDQTKDLLGVISSEPQKKLSVTQIEKLLGGSDIDSFKKLLKGLVEKVWWQREAASATATVMTQCKLGTGKQRGSGSKGDTWLLFAGPDRVGKRKMASALSEQVCHAGPTMISFGSRSGDRGSNMSFRGKTVLDRITEAVRRNPFSVIMLEDFDEADILVHGSIKRAMDTGRISDSYGREISLGNVTIILAINWSLEDKKDSLKDIVLGEEKLETLARSSWQLKLSVSERTTKRRANWLEDDRFTRPRKDMGLSLGFDLNESVDLEEVRADGSHNSSDLTVEREAENALDRGPASSASSLCKELINHVDDTIDFATVDFSPFVHETITSIGKMFASIVGDRVSIEVNEEAVQKIMGGIWLGETGVEEWMEGVLIPCFHKLRMQLPSTASMSSNEPLVAKLETVSDDPDDGRPEGDWLPSNIQIAIQGDQGSLFLKG
ncbi:hypothetical protein MLD38_014914 [Melastoma candidum]|uniref:Uncharacterized protein n=1 Tax=Melastoma candidum TaxID=119954 RepID=A0ACB9RI16_9MYRT|nr:hypothetical protein MLD38_014914 [Melastoma candidum]